jgi:hypothetical protein
LSCASVGDYVMHGVWIDCGLVGHPCLDEAEGEVVCLVGLGIDEDHSS